MFFDLQHNAFYHNPFFCTKDNIYLYVYSSWISQSFLNMVYERHENNLILFILKISIPHNKLGMVLFHWISLMTIFQHLSINFDLMVKEVFQQSLVFMLVIIFEYILFSFSQYQYKHFHLLHFDLVEV